MSLRIVALDTPRLCRSTRDLEPIGSWVATKSATMACNTSNRRSSALPIAHHPHLQIPTAFILRSRRDLTCQRLIRGLPPAGRARRLAFSGGPVQQQLEPKRRRKRLSMIFKGVRDGKPYPEHGLSYRDWSQIPPQQIRLDELVTTTTVLALDRLLSEDSTFYGDLFPHAVRWKGITYLEDGLHRAVRAALRNRTVLHARVYDMDMPLHPPG